MAALFLLPALAQAATIESDQGNLSFTCNAGHANINDQMTRPPAGFEGPIAHVMFVYENVLFHAVAEGYCSVLNMVEGPILAAASLAFLIFAISFLIGVTRLSAREAGVILFKVGLVLAFALNADLAMSVIYRFFLTLSMDASHWLSGSGTLLSQDNFFNKFSDAFGNPNPAPGNTLANVFTSTAKTAGGKTTSCAESTMIYLVFLITVVPLFGAPLVTVILTYGMIFIRTVLGYLVSLGAITLLMAASPIFIGFAMFKNTYEFFEHWLSSMISYSVQVVLTFGILLVALNLFDPLEMFTGLVSALRPMDSFWLSGLIQFFEWPQVCTPCKGGTFDLASGFTHPFMQYKCDNADGVGLIDSLLQFEFYKFLAANLTYVGMVIWGIMELAERAPEIAHGLAGNPHAMLIAGGTVNSKGERDVEFAMPVFDASTRNFIAGFRYGYDPGVDMDVKEKIRRFRPDYLVPENAILSPFERMMNGFKTGLEFAKSNRDPEDITAGLAETLTKEDRMLSARTEFTNAQDTVDRLKQALALMKLETSKKHYSERDIEDMERKIEDFEKDRDSKMETLRSAEADYDDAKGRNME